MTDSTAIQSLMPAAINNLDEYNRLRKTVCQSMATFHAFADEVDRAISAAGSTVSGPAALLFGLCHSILGRPAESLPLLSAAPDSPLRHLILGRCQRGVRRSTASSIPSPSQH